jgi:hypothetical protein
MNNNELKDLMTLLKHTTNGPWVSFIEGRDHMSGSSFIRTGDSNYDIDFIKIRPADQDFIASARNILPLLVDELKRLQNILNNHNIKY